MIDNTNIKTTDWLTKGMTDEQIQKEKSKAIKQANRELARIEKRERRASMRAYRKMHRRHRKELVKLAKQDRDFDWGWLDEFVRTKIKHMYEYFSEGNNVWQTDDTRVPIVEQLKHILDLYDEIDHLWDSHISGHIKNEDGSITPTEESTKSYIKIRNREQELFEEIYSFIGCHIQEWWD
jgi:hypothetical protein